MEDILKQNIDEVVELYFCGATVNEAIEIVRNENKARYEGVKNGK